ncbi:MAG: hypothetical protein Q9224_004118 [Gallowayella concinna]
MTSIIKSLIAISAVFGSHSLAALLPRNDGPTAPPCGVPFTPYLYAGCYTDPKSPPALAFSPVGLNRQNMTVETCAAVCKGNNFRYAGIEYYGECYCGDSIQGTQAADNACTFPCTGNKSETCGGNNLLSVFMDPTYPPSDSSDIMSYTPEGCYTEGYNGRAVAFRQSQLDSKSMTTKTCLGACKRQNFPLAALEFGGECYCGVVLGNGTASAPETECSTKCTGDSTDFCGGRSRLNLYVASDLMSTEPCSPFVLPPPVVRSSTSASITQSTILSSSSLYTPGITASVTQSTSSTFSAAESSTTSSEPTNLETPSLEASTTQSTSSETVRIEWSTSETSTTHETSSEATMFENTSSSTLTSITTTTDSTTSETTSTTSPSVTSTAPATDDSISSTTDSQSPSSAAGPTTSDGSNSQTTTSESSSSSLSSSTWSSPSSSTSSITSITSTTSSPTSSITPPSSTLSSTTSQATTTTISKSSTVTPPTSIKITTSSTQCISTVTPTPSCEFVTGKFCSKPIRAFADHPTCKIAVAECILQIADCFLSAGWPASLQCAKYQSWCQSVSTYCGNICPGGRCTKRDCISKNPPVGGQKTTTSTTIDVCPATTSTSSTATTSSIVPIPTVTSVCLLPNGPSGSGYSNGKCVGGIQPPALTCNNIRQDFAQFPLKLYTSRYSSQCSGYTRTKVSQACKDACLVQYNSCVGTYATGCKGQTQSGDRDSYDSAKNKCTNQYSDCLAINRGADVGHRCTSFGQGWS